MQNGEEALQLILEKHELIQIVQVYTRQTSQPCLLACVLKVKTTLCIQEVWSTSQPCLLACVSKSEDNTVYSGSMVNSSIIRSLNLSHATFQFLASNVYTYGNLYNQDFHDHHGNKNRIFEKGRL